tara:strand:- start:109441 stop:109746 length:306 start_codon:yes stop_codon:yes gene_type:complete
LDWHVARPIKGITETYTVIIRFDTAEHLKQWVAASEREPLISKVQSLLARIDEFYVSSGLDFWFTSAGAKAKIPVYWKQYLITLHAIHALSSGGFSKDIKS